MSDNGSQGPTVVSAEEAWRQANIRALFDTLRQLYPLEDQKRLAAVATGTVQEQSKLAGVIDLYHSSEHTHIDFSLIEPAKIHVVGRNKKLTGLTMRAPLRIKACKDLDEVMKSVTAFAILSSPITQAVLALHGYKIKVSVGSYKEPDGEAPSTG